MAVRPQPLLLASLPSELAEIVQEMLTDSDLAQFVRASRKIPSELLRRRRVWWLRGLVAQAASFHRYVRRPFFNDICLVNRKDRVIVQFVFGAHNRPGSYRYSINSPGHPSRSNQTYHSSTRWIEKPQNGAFLQMLRYLLLGFQVDVACEFSKRPNFQGLCIL